MLQLEREMNKRRPAPTRKDSLSSATQDAVPSSTLVQRARQDPHRLPPDDIQLLQQRMGNQAVAGYLGRNGSSAVIQRETIRTYDAEGEMEEKEAAWQETETFGLRKWQRQGDYQKPAKQFSRAFKRQEWEDDRETLLRRIGRIQVLRSNPTFMGLIEQYLETLRKNGEKYEKGENLSRSNPEDFNKAVCDGIIAEFERIHGFEVPYRWFVQNQNQPDFFEKLLPEKAQVASGHGRFWSKLYIRRSEKAAEGSETKPEGVFLESSVPGVIFDGLNLGMPIWNASPTMGYLWEMLSTTYANHLHGSVEADVLDGRDPQSVLSNHEWYKLHDAILSGKVESFTVNIYEFRDNQFKRTKEVRITKENLTGWYGEVPQVPGTQKWREHQFGVDRREKMLWNLDNAFRGLDEDIREGRRLVTVKDVKEHAQRRFRQE